MDISALGDFIARLFQLFTASTASTLLTIFGFSLLAVAGILAYWKANTKYVATLSLAAALFAAAGPTYGALLVEKNVLKKMDAEQVIKNLEDNAEVNYVIRLISYNPNEEPALAINRLTTLGPSDQLYSFVAAYDELVGYKVVDALAKAGQGRDAKRVSAIIFPLRAVDKTNLFPANARGLLQVVREVETRKAIQAQLNKKLVDGTGALNAPQMKGLEGLSVPSYRLANFKDNYRRYCELAREIHCGDGYSAKAYIGALSVDWHPLGFSQKNPPLDRCTLSIPQYCAFTDWKATKNDYGDHFGSRAFLIRNLEINNIPGRIMIDFDKPDQQVIPDIGAR